MQQQPAYVHHIVCIGHMLQLGTALPIYVISEQGCEALQRVLLLVLSSDDWGVRVLLWRYWLFFSYLCWLQTLTFALRFLNYYCVVAVRCLRCFSDLLVSHNKSSIVAYALWCLLFPVAGLVSGLPTARVAAPNRWFRYYVCEAET